MSVAAARPLVVTDLSVDFKTDEGLLRAVDHVSFAIDSDETLGIVGESGSGKSVTSMAIMGLLPRNAIISGSIRFRGQEMLGMRESNLRAIRGNRLAMVFQDALTGLNPVQRIGDQIGEAIAVHSPHRVRIGSAVVRDRVVELLKLVGIADPQMRAELYPHECSGGMRQRAMIAMALANDPDVLIADEPTTALDVTIQAQVLEVLRQIQHRTKTSIVLITHDLGVVAGIADRVMVMYAGKQCEMGSVDEVFYSPAHPYTRGLLNASPRIDLHRSAQHLVSIKGQPPSLLHRQPGCAFAPRCDFAVPGRCDDPSAYLRIDSAAGVRSSCLRSDELEQSNGIRQ